jgi:hypothetical protein
MASEAAVVALRQRLGSTKRQKVKCKEQLLSYEFAAEVSEQQREVRASTKQLLETTLLQGELLLCPAPASHCC